MKSLVGIVSSTRMLKTATVTVTRFRVHPLYKKRIRIRKKYHVDNSLKAKENEMVEIVPCRPLSKTKKWRIKKILKTVHDSNS